MTTDDFSPVGAWRLLSSVIYRNGVGTATYGDPPSGQIQYTADGRMSAFLMDPAWARSENLQPNTRTEFYAYAGRWTLHGDQLSHAVEFASVPMSVGDRFERTVKILAPDRIELSTAPETTRSGAVYATILLWERYAAAQS